MINYFNKFKKNKKNKKKYSKISLYYYFINKINYNYYMNKNYKNSSILVFQLKIILHFVSKHNVI